MSVFRFAPSPNGYLHLGHAYSALLNADMARVRGGRLLLRIEDIDETRCRPEYEMAIYEDLRWLGLSWEEPVLRQSQNLAAYQAALDALKAQEVLYPAFESRAEIARFVAECEPWPRDPDGAPLYPGMSRQLSAAKRQERMASGVPFVWRLDIAKAIDRAGAVNWQESGAGPAGETGAISASPAQWGDVILGRRETPASYHLSVVVDDAAQNVTNVVRGADLFHATGLHRLLQMLLGLPEPAYHHHRLILDAHGRKLSKSSQATGLRELRAQGKSPADIRRMIGL
ncbi:MAG: tRNA glutamyl-Q(34) synthetase GluQRS [Pseudolabrys sp.]|nr:tRNA glutamyl-Q(34) synthetase GluQRS [Pseudolabrys sp.]